MRGFFILEDVLRTMISKHQVAPVYGPDVNKHELESHTPAQYGFGSTINGQFWFDQSPWRLTAAWSLVAALISLGLLADLNSLTQILDWHAFVLSLILVDLLWGFIWRIAWGTEGLLRLGRHQYGSRFWLPYLQANSPAAILMGRPDPGPSNGSSHQDHAYHQDIISLVFRTGLPTLILAFGIALSLGSAALWLTTCAVLCGLLGWISRRNWGQPSALLQAIVVIALPWLLAKALMTIQAGNEMRIDSQWSYSLSLMTLWAIHYWGIARYCQSVSASALVMREAEADLQMPQQPVERSFGRMTAWEWLKSVEPKRISQIAPLAVADIGLVVLLIVIREPLWLAFIIPLCTPMWMSFFQELNINRQPVWRLLAMVLTALALGQRLL